MCRSTSQPRRIQSVRTIFISDIHLGCKHSQARQLAEFLSRFRPQFVYLVGDIIDGRSLRRRWRWAPEFTRVLIRLLDLAAQGTVLRYAIGNHDDFLRKEHSIGEFLPTGIFEVAEEFVHTMQDRQHFLILHGDRFDTVEQSAGFLSVISSVFYELLLTANKLWNRCRHSQDSRQYSLSSHIKRRVKSIVKYISNFEARIVEHAKKMNCEGVICGHIHAPVMTEIDGLTYCNTGDWVENCTALVEHDDGRLELIYFDELQQTPETPADIHPVRNPAGAERASASRHPAGNGQLAACSLVSE